MSKICIFKNMTKEHKSAHSLRITLRFIFAFNCCDRIVLELTGSEVGERQGGWTDKGPPAKIQTQDARSTMTLYVAIEMVNVNFQYDLEKA